MKILFISAASNIHTVRWVNALNERNHDVLLVSMKEHYEKDNIIDSKVKRIYLPLTGSKGYYLNAFHLRAIYNKYKPDIVNVHYASGYGTLARVACLPRTILSVWGSDVFEFPYQSKLKYHILKKNLMHATIITSSSYVMAEQVKRITNSSDIRVVPFGVNTNRFKPESLVKDGFTIGIVKTLEPTYGVDTVIEAFSIFVHSIPINEKVKLVICGRGSQQEELRKLCEKLDVNEKVEFKGYISNQCLPEIINSIDIICLGSKRESFGVSAIEAMACERPVIATCADGFKEIIEDGKSGFIVPIGDSAKMAEKITELYFNEKLRRVIGHSARQRVKKLYEWDENVEYMIEKVYKSVLGYMA